MGATNIYSKEEDSTLKSTMEDILYYANTNLLLPDGYCYDIWDKIGFDRMYQWQIDNGLPEESVKYLLNKNDGGDYSSITPDGGVIVIIKKDIGGNILEWYPLLASEAKHQESDVGNAIERFFKNYNAFKELFSTHEIFPYLCFCQGAGFTSMFQQNKLIIGSSGFINQDVDIHDEEIIVGRSRFSNKLRIKYKKRSNIFAREEKWTTEEMRNRLLEALKQSYDYFIPIIRCQTFNT